MKRFFLKRAAFLFAIILTGVIISCSHTGRQAQFRSFDASKALPEIWSNDKNVKWSYDLEGRGWSSAIISGNRVYITTAVNETTPPKEEAEQPGPPAPEQGDSVRRPPRPQGPPREGGEPPEMKEDTTYKHEVYRMEVICLNLKTGKEVWKQVAFRGNPRTSTNPGNGYASETPATDGKRVYAYFGMTGLFCYDPDGKLLWKKDPGAYKTLNGWGTGSSPVLYENMVYLQIDNEQKSFIVALDGATGAEKWKAERDEKTNYSTPVIWKNSIRTELVAGGKTVRSYDPLTGKILWQCTIGGEFSIPSSVSDNDYLYTGNAGGPEKPGNLIAIKAGASGDITLLEGKTESEWVKWFLPAAGTANPSPLLYNGLIYIVGINGGELTCFEASTGKIIYKQKIEKVGSCWASPWRAGNRVWFLDERGFTRAVKAGQQFELLSQNRINDRFWTTPAAAEGVYVFKGVKKLYCISN
jgi:outer membrane protein assembly factor BamB